MVLLQLEPGSLIESEPGSAVCFDALLRGKALLSTPTPVGGGAFRAFGLLAPSSVQSRA
jgi:hypothetical protein